MFNCWWGVGQCSSSGSFPLASVWEPRYLSASALKTAQINEQLWLKAVRYCAVIVSLLLGLVSTKRITSDHDYDSDCQNPMEEIPPSYLTHKQPGEVFYGGIAES